jgi:hypothetical protein
MQINLKKNHHRTIILLITLRKTFINNHKNKNNIKINKLLKNKNKNEK